MDVDIGRVSCTFEDSSSTPDVPVCPHVANALGIAAEFKHDNLVWLGHFRGAMQRMMTNGYDRPSCGDEVCKLRS